MKKILLKILFIPLITSSVYAETLIFKTHHWCPFSCISGTTISKEQGFIIDITKIIFERKGHNIDYQVDNWQNSIDSVRSGKATAIAMTSIMDAPDFIYPVRNVGSNKECFYVRRKDPWEFLTIDNLSNRKLGVSGSYAYSAELTNFLLEHPLQVVKNSTPSPLLTSLQSLDNHVVDTVVENPFVFNYTTESMKIRDKYEEAGCTTGDPLFVGFSPKHPRSKEFAKILTDGIEDLRKDGTLDKIITKYSLKDWSP